MKRNLSYKLLALSIAVIIWMYAGDRQNPAASREEIRNLPLEFHGIPAGYTVVEGQQSLRVMLEGPRNYVTSIAAQRDSVSAFVDLQDKGAGRHILPVSVKIPDGFSGIVTAHSTPREVTVTLEKKVERALRVDVQFADTPPVGYKFSAPQISPGRVVVSGRANVVNRVSKVVIAIDTVAANLASIDGDFALTPLDSAGKPVQGVDASPERVHLRMELLEAPATRAVFVSLDAVGQPPFPYRVVSMEVQPQTVVVTGRPEQLMNVTTLKTEAVQLQNHTKTFTQRVQVVPPPGLTLVDDEHVRVTVRIEAPPGSEVEPGE